MSGTRFRTALYWALVSVLIGFGYLAIFSIGLLFLIPGVALALLAPVRRRPVVFWPAMAGIGAFLVAVVVLSPLGCSTSSTAAVPGGSGLVARSFVRCTNLLGLPYSGPAPYSPSLWPAFLAALAVGVLTAAGGRWLARRLAPRFHPSAAPG